MTDRTEFEEPDKNGLAKEKENLKKRSLGGALQSISKVGRKLGLKVSDRTGIHNRNQDQKGILYHKKKSSF